MSQELFEYECLVNEVDILIGHIIPVLQPEEPRNQPEEPQHQPEVLQSQQEEPIN